MTQTTEYQPSTRTGRVANFVNTRTGMSAVVREFGRKIFPDHWSFMFGEVALYSFIILLLSGTFLTFFFDPSMAETHYDGSYVPLRGVEMSVAFQSSLDISFDVRGGLFMRQLHHWAALLFMAAMAVHMCRIFFTGAFRRPRELNWVVGCLLIFIGIFAGFTGYSLPDDLLSGNGLRIIDGVIKSIPVIGTYISFFLFGGEFPGTAIISRLYMLHILLIPAIILLLIAIHLVMVVVHKHTQYPGPGRREDNVVGFPVGPVYAFKAGGFLFVVFGALALIAGFFQINPIWNYGPYDPSPVSAGTQPDWYVGWVDGILRLMPGMLGDFSFERVIPFPWGDNVLILNVIGPVATVVLALVIIMVCWPWIERWFTKDNREHHILDRPRNAPFRTATGVAACVLYGTMWAAASSDIIATHFKVSLNDVTYWLRTLLIIGPFIAFWITRRICLSLQRKDRETVLHGRETGQVFMSPEGGYEEKHQQLDEYKRWRLVSFKTPTYIPAQPDEDGNISRKERRRAWWAKFFLEDRVAPVTPAELEAAHHDHHEVKGDDDKKELGH
ncbi:cytochrome b N-terminal domain-containing protein [Galactobacter sp.]|uniref:cytochrome bc1 complex cytochrome b subunit n=1 Tax=Galactobacter sp. TaxID=2676125 RepID=UPI0025C5D1D5|nr:cytochrome b N-terminal domain-containing protein [Galactobacter sp.]